MREKIIVLGAGIAGLAAAIKLLQSGKEVTLIEKNSDVGGLCNGYFVDGYYIDNCIHWLMGTAKGNNINDLWNDIGALSEDTPIISLPTLGTFEYQGTKVTFYRDLTKAEEEWTKISPIDKKAIHKFFSAVKDVSSIMNVVLTNEKHNLMDLIRPLPSFTHIVKSMRESREEYSKRFKHPALQFAIKNAQTGYNNMFFFFDLYGIFSKGNADVPQGGALEMIKRIKNKFLSLGGTLLTGCEATKLVVNEGKVTSVITSKGEIKGDIFISTIDPNYTYKMLLENKYESKLYNKLNKNIEKNTISSCFNVYFSIEGDLSNIDVPTGLNISPIKVGNTTTDFVLFRNYSYDDCFKKDNKVVGSLFVDQNQDDYNYFKSLSSSNYKQEVNRICNELLNSLKEKYPHLKIEYLSHFSPLDLEKWTNTSYGSIQSYSYTNKGLFYVFNGRTRGLSNLYMCGQWCRSIGGTPTALLTGNEIAKLINRD